MKTAAFEKQRRNAVRRGTKKYLLLFEGPLQPTKGAFWKDVYFNMFLSQGNFKDEKVEQDLILPRI